MTLSEQLTKLRKELCTGPCGQSMAVMQRRDEQHAILTQAISQLNGLKSLIKAQQHLIDIYEYNCDRADCTDHDLPQSILEAEQNIANLRSGLDL